MEIFPEYPPELDRPIDKEPFEHGDHVQHIPTGDTGIFDCYSSLLVSFAWVVWDDNGKTQLVFSNQLRHIS